MIKKLNLLLITIFFAGMLQAQEILTTNQQAVQQTVINMFDALSNRDSVSLKAHCTADITLFEYGQAWNRDTLILKAITQNQSAGFKRTNHFDFINTTVDKSTSWVTYHLKSVIIKEDKQVTLLWLETVILAKEKKQWKVKHLHSTLIKRS